MKKLFLSVALAGLFLSACQSNKTDNAGTSAEQQAAANEGTEFGIDTTSIIHWQLAHKGGLKPRYGTLKVDSGSLFVKDGAVNAGSFVIQLNSLMVDPASTGNDKEEGHKSTDLAGHLLSPDFFDAAKFPSVKFVITSVTAFDAAKDKSLLEGANQMVSGNLTIKDSTVNVTFPAKITLTEKDADIKAKFTVDRASWGLRYGAEGDPKDWAIQKDIELNLDVKAQVK